MLSVEKQLVDFGEKISHGTKFLKPIRHKKKLPGELSLESNVGRRKIGAPRNPGYTG